MTSHALEHDASTPRGSMLAEPDEWTAVLRRIPAQTYPAGVELFDQGDTVREVHFIGRGLVKLQHVCPDGREAIVGLRSVGWILGAAESILRQPYAVAARTVTPCEIHRMETTSFRNAAHRGHHSSWLVHVIHSREVLTQLDQVVAFNCLSAHERLRALLHQLLTVLSHETRFAVQVPLRDWEIAQLVGVTPQYLSRLMHRLEAEGFLSRRDHRWLIE